MHLESCLKKEAPLPEVPKATHQILSEKELEAIMEREFGPVRRPVYSTPQRRVELKEQSLPSPTAKPNRLIVDGYNIIFAWDSLRTLAQTDLEAARHSLAELLCNYSAYTKCETVLVFDAYKVRGGIGTHESFQNLRIVYTKENETGDQYIERLIHEIGKNEQVRVVTSDNLIRVSAMRGGILRISAQEFEREYAEVENRIADWLKATKREKLGTVRDRLKKSDDPNAE